MHGRLVPRGSAPGPGGGQGRFPRPLILHSLQPKTVRRPEGRVWGHMCEPLPAPPDLGQHSCV